MVNISIHDAERGTEEYGGYGIAASAISFNKLIIPKPVLVARDIYTYLMSSRIQTGQNYGGSENNIIEAMFKESVEQIFRDNLVFAYIFGSYARNRAKSYSDVDTMVCVKKKNEHEIKSYLGWLFWMSEVFGKIPDFKYPSEIVEFDQLQNSVLSFKNLNLGASTNSAEAYDSMVWLHSLSHYKIAVVNEQNIPDDWDSVFPSQSTRIVKGFLSDLENRIRLGTMANTNYFSNISANKNELDNYISNLGNGRKLIDILKYISFDEKILYGGEVIELIGKRQFFGKKIFNENRKSFNFEQIFRFGVI